ncbi:MAG: helix-turn-helix transcriptional regulator [Elusimicrobiales bacterium]|nr:helix-turn-helix transcriptional regulator [Elusimicrobiales bacterium]
MSSVQTDRYRRFIAQLVKARLDAGLTQVQAAAKLRKLQSYVSKCELGERRIDFTELETFAKLYGKPLEFFRTLN